MGIRRGSGKLFIKIFSASSTDKERYRECGEIFLKKMEIVLYGLWLCGMDEGLSGGRWFGCAPDDEANSSVKGVVFEWDGDD